jgi:hypothetical protein
MLMHDIVLVLHILARLIRKSDSSSYLGQSVLCLFLHTAELSTAPFVISLARQENLELGFDSNSTRVKADSDECKSL